MLLANIAVGTTTQYSSKDDKRGSLAVQTLETLAAAGYRTSVVDGGSHSVWLERFSNIKGVTLTPETLDIRTGEPSMGAGRRQTLAIAKSFVNARGVVVWMEPEKIDFVKSIGRAAKMILDGHADVVMPRRKSLDSYPPEQQAAETLGNWSAQNLLGGKPLDFWFGPRLWSMRALPCMLDYAAPGSVSYGDKWDSIMVPALNAMAAGLRVASVDVDYTHPSDQTKQETGDIKFTLKRIEQLYNIVPALEAHVEYLGIRGCRARS